MFRRVFILSTAAVLSSRAQSSLGKAERVKRALAGKELDRQPFTFWHHFGLKTAQALPVHLMEELESTPESRIPLISIAKEQDWDIGEKGKGLYEKIYLPGRKNPLFLHRFPDILHLLMRVRDETHRFAISHYQNVHRTSLLTSALDSISGIGPKRRRMLLQHFGSMETLREASAEDLESAGLPRPVAENVVRVLAGLDGDEDISEEALEEAEKDENMEERED